MQQLACIVHTLPSTPLRNAHKVPKPRRELALDAVEDRLVTHAAPGTRDLSSTATTRVWFSRCSMSSSLRKLSRKRSSGEPGRPHASFTDVTITVRFALAILGSSSASTGNLSACCSSKNFTSSTNTKVSSDNKQMAQIHVAHDSFQPIMWLALTDGPCAGNK